MGRNPETVASYSSPTGLEFNIKANGRMINVADENALRNVFGNKLEEETSVSFDIEEGGQILILDVSKTDRETFAARTNTLYGRNPNGKTPILYARAYALAIEIAAVKDKPVEFGIITDDAEARQWALSPQTRVSVEWDETIIRHGKFQVFKLIEPQTIK